LLGFMKYPYKFDLIISLVIQFKCIFNHLIHFSVAL
jgi:hypothetical protein